jgi:hypothetical protein
MTKTAKRPAASNPEAAGARATDGPGEGGSIVHVRVGSRSERFQIHDSKFKNPRTRSERFQIHDSKFKNPRK